MDTGYVNLLDDRTRFRVLDEVRGVLGDRRFIAGAFVADLPGDSFSIDSFRREFDAIRSRGGTPVIFQSYALTAGEDAEILARYYQMAGECDDFIAFELGRMFAPYGRVYSLEVYLGLMTIPNCLGAKLSSLRRGDEWRRLMMRDEVRPEFRVFTGNDLAIDMVMYGSDYLLGLSTFAPDLFARRDALWASGDAAFHELNDTLQYLGAFAFARPCRPTSIPPRCS